MATLSQVSVASLRRGTSGHFNERALGKRQVPAHFSYDFTSPTNFPLNNCAGLREQIDRELEASTSIPQQSNSPSFHTRSSASRLAGEESCRHEMELLTRLCALILH